MKKIMFKHNWPENFNIGVEIDGNKVVVTEVTNGVVSDVISVTLGSLRESWEEATHKYKKYMKNNLFTVSLSNKCLMFNNIKLDYTTLHQDHKFKEIVEVQENVFLKQEVFAATISETNELLPTNTNSCNAIVNGYSYSDLDEVLEVLSPTQAQIVSTSFLFNKINYTVIYTSLENCFISHNTSPRLNFNLKSGGILNNIQGLTDIDEDNTALDRFLDIIDGNLLDVDALVKVVTMVEDIANEIKVNSTQSREKFILAGILSANPEIRKTFEGKGIVLETSIYENPVWGDVPFNDRGEFLVSLLAAKNSEYLPRYTLIKESDLIYRDKIKKERKNNTKTHLIGVSVLLLGLILGTYPLLETGNAVQRLQETQSRLENRISETEETYSYYNSSLPELLVLQENNYAPLPAETVSQILQSQPPGVTASGFSYENSEGVNYVTIEAYGFNSPSVLEYWLSELNNRDDITKAWVESYSDTGTSATYFIKIELVDSTYEELLDETLTESETDTSDGESNE